MVTTTLILICFALLADIDCVFLSGMKKLTVAMTMAIVLHPSRDKETRMASVATQTDDDVPAATGAATTASAPVPEYVAPALTVFSD